MLQQMHRPTHRLTCRPTFLLAHQRRHLSRQPQQTHRPTHQRMLLLQVLQIHRQRHLSLLHQQRLLPTHRQVYLLRNQRTHQLFHPPLEPLQTYLPTDLRDHPQPHRPAISTREVPVKQFLTATGRAGNVSTSAVEVEDLPRAKYLNRAARARPSPIVFGVKGHVMILTTSLRRKPVMMTTSKRRTCSVSRYT